MAPRLAACALMKRIFYGASFLSSLIFFFVDCILLFYLRKHGDLMAPLFFRQGLNLVCMAWFGFQYRQLRVPAAEAPMAGLTPNHPALLEAEAEARARWGEFRAAFTGTAAGQNCRIKARLHAGMEFEYPWLRVASIEDGLVHAVFEEDAVVLNHRRGSKVEVPVEDVCDWQVLRPGEDAMGGFSLKVVEQLNVRSSP